MDKVGGKVGEAVESVAEKVIETVKDVAGAVADTVAGTAEAVARPVETVAHKVVGQDPPLPLPETREQLLALHQAARAKRDAAPLESHDRAQAAFELERIEILIARVERAMDPPLV